MSEQEKISAAKRKDRYSKLYDAYRDEADSDDLFWSSLSSGNAPAREATSVKSETPDGKAAPVRNAAPVKAVAPAEKELEKSEIRKVVIADDEEFDDDEEPVKRRIVSERSGSSDDGSGGSGSGGSGSGGGTSRAARRKKEQKRKLRRGRRMFIVFMVLWSIALIVLGIWLWRYTDRCLVDYEKSQPENNVDRLLEEFIVKARDGSVVDNVNFTQLPGEFESPDILKEQYVEKLKSVKSFTWEKNKQSYSTTKPVYDILGDGQTVATMTIESYNPRRILAILEVCDWKIERIDPVVEKVKTSNYRFTVPSKYTVVVNGRTLTSDFVISRGEVPSYLKLLEEYTDYDVEVVYEIKRLLNAPTVEIRNAEGQTVEPTKDESGNVVIHVKPYAKFAEMPDDRKQIAETISKKWMDLTTNDLSGSDRGLSKMREDMVKDAQLYKDAEQYAKSIDIKFVSSHVLGNPPYTGFAIDNYVEYSDRCFSCHVAFVKHMVLTKNKKSVVSEMDDTFYFVYIDQTDDGKDNPRWLLLDTISGVVTNGAQ
ncbi:MAG: hypothetical protein IJM57_02175 [Lachnospiraceae bacterium]|nr:hypothetical protein [Lachnospiraceae bacterium]